MTARRRWALRLVFGLLLLGAPVVRAQSPAPGLESIRKADLKADVFFLASDEMRGRETATAENRLAAAFIRARFERLGIAPGGPSGSYLQPFELVSSELGQDLQLVVRDRDGQEQDATLGKEFFPEPFTASATAAGPIVFAGFGITAPALAHDDYRDADVRGKVVVVLNHEPDETNPDSPFDGEVSSEHARPQRKALNAQQHGAAAVLFVTDVQNHPDRRDLSAAMRTTWPGPERQSDRVELAIWADQVRIPVLDVSPELAEQLVKPAGRPLDALAREAERTGGIAAVPLPGIEVRISTSVTRRRLTATNVLGMVEGADPRLRHEWVVVGAHFDHTGVDDDRIFNGADDNASGVAGLLEVAEALARAADEGRRPRRSILLAAWNAEERGLLGTWAFTERPPVPLDRIVAVVNMDMIGRDEEIPADGGMRFAGLDPQTARSNHNAVNLLGYSRSADLREAATAANRSIGLDLRFRYDNNRSNLLRRSDHWPFLFHGVPAIFIHTGLHPDYHTERDRPEKINYEKMERIVRFVWQLSWDLAQGDGRPGLTP